MSALSGGALRVVKTAALLLVLAGLLRLLDLGPRLSATAGRLHALPSIEAAEHAAGRRLSLPSYFPRSLPWPPTRVLALGRGPDAVALELTRPDAGLPSLVLAESVRAPVPLPDELFPPALRLDAQPLTWRGETATLTHLRGEDGAAWLELAWTQDGQAFAFRSRESLEQLLDLAASVHREGP